MNNKEPKAVLGQLIGSLLSIYSMLALTQFWRTFYDIR
ncbi:hypothetical protein J2T15_004938 [Paenibacillus harenae]|uniref:Uncharacterized protein n=1 Tax=Paenibacillus harenae TaxID=306543 RepID=A0ABT9U750_PAEHA|nr:hypothetical protein [Paenibacillus harenae]